MLCVGATLAVPLQDVPLDPEATVLALHHPGTAVFELEPGQSAEPVLDWIVAHPDLRFDQIERAPTGTTITATPIGPLPAAALTEISEHALSTEGLRFVQAPASRTWQPSVIPRGGALLGMVLLLGLQLWGRRSPSRVLPILLALAASSWWLAPLHPLTLLLLPLALAIGLAIWSEQMATPWAAALGIGAAASLGMTQTPALIAAGALCLCTLVAGILARPAPPSARAVPIPRRAAGLFLIGVGALALSTLLAPAPTPVALLDPVPQTATVSVEPSRLDELHRALTNLGLGRIGTTGSNTLVVPLAAPWVEPFFTDTLDAIAPEAVWSGPIRPSVRTPWLTLGAWGLAVLLIVLGRAPTVRQASASLPLLLAPCIALVWGTASATPGVFALGMALFPALGTIFLLRRDPLVLGMTLIGVCAPLLLSGLLVPGVDGLGWSGLALVLLGPLAAMTTARMTEGWPGTRLTRWAPRLAWAGVVAVHLDVLLLLSTGFRPPPTTDLAQVDLGPHRRVRSQGVFVLYTEGEPYETGFAAGRLADDLRIRLEEELFDAFTRNVPNAGARWLITRGSSLVGTGLNGTLLPAHRVELRGDVDAAGERYAFGGASYTRKVYYHAIHDIGQALVDTPLLGCTGFAAGPTYTPDGHWRVARAFDFDGGVAFDRDKVLRVHRPEEGIPFLSVSFAGIVGAVSGVNQAGIAVVINASGSDDAPRVGTPMTLIVREILQHAHTLDEAEAILRSRSGFVSENVMVIDADGDRGALFEVSPAQMVRVDIDGAMAMSNHFRSTTFAEHETNLDRMEELTSVPRLARAEELVAEHAGHIDQSTAAYVLEDRSGVGGIALPRGHRHALNADIATHGVVIDATTRSLWVSVYPNLSGGWVSLSLEDALKGKLEPVLERGAAPDAWRSVETRRARELLRSARRHRGSTALKLATRAQQLWPEHPEALLERGRRELTDGDPILGRSLLEAARQAPVEYPRDLRALDQALGAP